MDQFHKLLVIGKVAGAAHINITLCSYKQALLGQAKSEQVIVDADDPRNVLLRSITLVVEGRPDITMHLDKGKFLCFGSHLSRLYNQKAPLSSLLMQLCLI